MSTKCRVPNNTSELINRQISEEVKKRLEYFAVNPAEIDRRLRQLDEEWDVERILETNSSIASIFGLAMGFLKDRRWFVLPLVVQSFFLQHSIQGWCPPLPILRRLGARTQDEINYERYALKALRGDFERINAVSNSTQIPSSANELVEAVTH